MKKIILIGQAPPAKEQELPYDSTLLYSMLEWCKISKEDAQVIFEFEAIATNFRGSKSGQHLRPLRKDIEDHWPDLCAKVEDSAGVITLGEMARHEWSHNTEFFKISGVKWLGVSWDKLNVLSIPHPSRRNYSIIMNNKPVITHLLTTFIHEYSDFYKTPVL